jgi:hypothetical protein
MLVVMFKDCRNPLRILEGSDRCGKDPEPGRQHVPPIYSDLPCAAFVSEEQEVIGSFVDLAHQTKDNLEGLAYRP